MAKPSPSATSSGAGRYPEFVRWCADSREDSIDAHSRDRDDVMSGAVSAESETYHVRVDVAEMLGVAPSDTTESSSLSS